MKSYTLLDILNNSVEYLKEEKEVKIELSGIKIPRIQRDYAQGREDEENIRNRFLKALFTHLVSKKETMDLDFIYGSLKEFDDKNYFTPLDGQQRITTLFLLNWYVSNVELEGQQKVDYLEKLSSFSYETRPAAKNFCKELVKYKFDKTPVPEIINQKWFLEFYTQDPTISSMLNMLETIHKLYVNHNVELFHRLSSLRFYIMPLDGFNLSDELYIKMNARGKQLSDFENFKADLINWMKSENNIDYKDFSKKIDYHSKTLPYYLSIASKLDNEWSDLFWSAHTTQDYDESYLCFITRFFATNFATNVDKTINDISDSSYFKNLTKQKDNKIDFKYTGFEIFENNLSFDIIEKLEKVLDNYSINKDFINSNIFPLWDKTSDWKLYSMDIIPRQYDLFFGVVKYLEKNEFDKNKFKDWVRVVWNLIINPDIRSYPAAISLIKNELLPYSEYSYDINSNIVSKEFSVKFEKRITNTSFQTSIIYQEIEKAKFILKDSENLKKHSELIYELESHQMFKGHIAAFITFTDVLEEVLKLKNAAFLLCESDKPTNNKWIRSVLILNDDIKDYLKSKNSISLKDGSFENWNELINNELKTGFYKLLERISNDNLNIIDEIIDNFNFSIDKRWLWNLVKLDLKNEDGLTKCLMDYSDTMNLKYYDNNIYLFNQTIWTEGNVLLSSFRNQIISALLASTIFKFNIEKGNIKNQYFRGWNPTIYFTNKDVKISLIFKTNEVWIGIKDIDVEILLPDQISWIDTENISEGIFGKHIIYFSELQTLEETDIFATTITDYLLANYKN